MFSTKSLGLWKISQMEIDSIESTLKEHMASNGYTTVYPNPDQVFKALELCQPDKVRVVIIGQDPYHQLCKCTKHPRAQGFSFSVKDCDQTPVSLQNIFKEIKSCYPEWKIPDSGNLEHWAEQGVLLLNACLTVQPNKAGSHDTIWFGVVKQIIAQIDDYRPKTIYVMWGREAQSYEYYLPNSAIKLISSHPSGFSAQKGFLGCKHFKIINDLLEANGEPIIRWFK